MNKKNIYFFAYSYTTGKSFGTGNFTSEIGGILTFQDIQVLEKDISERVYKGEASVIVTNFIKMESE